MHPTLVEIHAQLELVINQTKNVIPNNEPLAIVHNNWSFPGITRNELVESAQEILHSIEDRGTDDDLGEHDALIKDYVRRITYLQNTVAQLWSTPAQAVPAYLFTLDGLRKALAPVLTRDGQAEAATSLRKMFTRLRGMDAKLNDLEPRTASLSDMVERIEQAHNAADQLPTDLESLSEARGEIASLVKKATGDQAHIVAIREQIETLNKQLKQYHSDAESVLTRCETAYSAATSVGLAAAFSERSSVLSKSMWIWVGGLVVALVVGGLLGSRQLQTLVELMKNPDVSTSVIAPNLLLALLSVGAPVWFAWLATKQIGERFRLSEDYAFKASISRAYEGFRREAARVDKDMEARLLASALTRLDELPLRLVEAKYHGSPWHELASSGVVKQAMEMVPDFAGQLKDFASNALCKLTQTKASPTPPTKSISQPKPTTEE